MAINTELTLGLALDSGGLYRQAAPAAVVDNIFIFTDGVNKWEIADKKGVYYARLGGVLPGSDMTSRLNAILAHADVKEVVFDSGDITISGTVTIPTGKKYSFKNGSKLIGSGTVNGGFINAGYQEHIFGSSIIINPKGATNGKISVKWWGAIGDNGGVDDQPAIQAAIDCAVRNEADIHTVFCPTGLYRIDFPIIIYNWNGSAYSFTGIRFEGEAQAGSATATQIRPNFKDKFAIGIQLGKGVEVNGFYIFGQYEVPAQTVKELMDSDVATWGDATCRESTYSHYAGIVIDPFVCSNTLPADGGYPGMSSWYRGTGGNGGSTGTQIRGVQIEKFTVCILNSPTGVQLNSEMLSIIDFQIGNCKYGILGSHDQERNNRVQNGYCWKTTFYFFATGLTGVQVGGEWHFENINIAGRVRQFIYQPNGYGRYPCTVKKLNSESMGRFGDYTSLHVEESVIGFFNGGEAGQIDVKHFNLLNGNATFEKCLIRVYDNQATPVTIRSYALFRECTFDTPPIITHVSGVEPQFVNCQAPGFFSSSGDIVRPNSSFLTMNYGDITLLGTVGQELPYMAGQYKWRFSGGRTVRYNVPLGNHTVTVVGAEREVTIQLSAGQGAWFETDVNGSVGYFDGTTNQYLFMGKVKSVNTGTDQMVIKWCSAAIVTGNEYYISLLPPKIIGVPFVGDVTNNSAVITNIVNADPGYPLSYTVGAWYENSAMQPTGSAYECVVKVLAYDSGANTITVNRPSYYTALAEYFGVKYQAEIDLVGANATLQASLFLSSGSIVKDNRVSLIDNMWQVTKAGFWGNSPKCKIKPVNKLTYDLNKVVSANYTVLASDKHIEVDSTSGNITISMHSNSVMDDMRAASHKEYSKIVTITKKVAANTVTINKYDTGEEFSGQSSIVLSAQYDYVQLMITDNGNYIIGSSLNSSSNKTEITSAVDVSSVVGANKLITVVVVKNASGLTAFKIGTTNAGEELAPEQAIDAGVPASFTLNKHSDSGLTLYFGGITSSTDIKIYTL